MLLPPGFLSDRLVFALLASAIVGALFPNYANGISTYTLLWLGVLVFSVGLTLDATNFREAVHRPLLILLTVALPPIVLLPLGVAAASLWPGPASYGLVAIASAPIEVSAVLLTAIALADAALATTAVWVSLLLAPATIPFAFNQAGVPAAISSMDLLLELSAGVALPLVLALLIRTLSGGQLRELYFAYGPEVGSVALALLLVGAGGAARLAVETNALDEGAYLVGAAGIVLALIVPFAIGASLSAALVLPRGLGAATMFACGMREFGVATAVAQLVFPASTVIPAVYGIALMLLASALARWLKKSG